MNMLCPLQKVCRLALLCFTLRQRCPDNLSRLPRLSKAQLFGELRKLRRRWSKIQLWARLHRFSLELQHFRPTCGFFLQGKTLKVEQAILSTNSLQQVNEHQILCGARLPQMKLFRAVSPPLHRQLYHLIPLRVQRYCWTLGKQQQCWSRAHRPYLNLSTRNQQQHQKVCQVRTVLWSST